MGSVKNTFGGEKKRQEKRGRMAELKTEKSRLSLCILPAAEPC